MIQILRFYYSRYQDLKNSTISFKIITFLFFLSLLHILFFPKVELVEDSILVKIAFYSVFIVIFITMISFLVWLDCNPEQVTFGNGDENNESNKMFVKLLARGAMLFCIFSLIFDKII